MSASLPRLSATVLILARSPTTTAAAVSSVNHAATASVRGAANSSTTSSAINQQYKILFVQRTQTSGFMASAHVFPGGVLDEADRDVKWRDMMRKQRIQQTKQQKSDSDDEVALRVCALREVFEETGVLLAQPINEIEVAASTSSSSTPSSFQYAKPYRFSSLTAQREAQARCSSSSSTFSSILPTCSSSPSTPLTLSLSSLYSWSRWITPSFEKSKRRYDTMFYLCALEHVVPDEFLTHDVKEVTQTIWLTPNEALTLASSHKIVLPPPTTYLLREIEHLTTIEDVFSVACSERKCEPILAHLIPSPIGDKCQHMVLPGDPTYEAAGKVLKAAQSGGASSSSSASSSSASTIIPHHTDRSQWHRMVRAADMKDMVTTIYRPAKMRLETNTSELSSSAADATATQQQERIRSHL